MIVLRDGKLRPEQEEWLTALSRCEGIHARVWRPRDFEEITRVLRRKLRS